MEFKFNSGKISMRKSPYKSEREREKELNKSLQELDELRLEINKLPQSDLFWDNLSKISLLDEKRRYAGPWDPWEGELTEEDVEEIDRYDRDIDSIKDDQKKLFGDHWAKYHELEEDILTKESRLQGITTQKRFRKALTACFPQKGAKFASCVRSRLADKYKKI